MKKAVFVLILISIAGILSAQLTFRAGVDTVFVPFQLVQHSNGIHTMGMGMGRYDANNQNMRARIITQLNLPYIGFLMQLQFMSDRVSDFSEDGNPPPNLFGFGDNVYVFWKPLGNLRFDAGKFMQDDLRGKINNNWTHKFTVGAFNGDEIFSRFRGRGFTNFSGGLIRSDFGFLTSFNYDNYTAYVLFPGLFPMNSRNGNWFFPYGNANWIDTYPQDHGVMEVVDSSGNNEILRVLERTQIAFSYKIPTKALFRVQYLGANKTSFSNGLWGSGGATPDFNNPDYLIDDKLPSTNTPRVEAAAQILMIKGLNLDIGAKYHLPWRLSDVKSWDKDDGKWIKKNEDKKGYLQKSSQISVGAVYTGIEKFNLVGRIDTKFAGTYDHENESPITKLPFELNFHTWPSYNFGFMITGLDFGLEYIGEKTKGSDVQIPSGWRVGGGAFGELRWNQCRLRYGILFRAPMEYGGTEEDMVFTIPLVFDYTF